MVVKSSLRALQTTFTVCLPSEVARDVGGPVAFSFAPVGMSIVVRCKPQRAHKSPIAHANAVCVVRGFPE